MKNNNKNLLIIEDNTEDQFLYKRFLYKIYGKNVTIQIAETVKSGLDYATHHSFNCILLDYQLPDFSGIEFLNMFKEISPDNNTPIVMLTGAGDEKVAVNALKLGAADYLIKGELTVESLKKTIDHACEKFELALKVKENESEMQQMAFQDYLTGIPNRRQFDLLANRALAAAKRHKRVLAIFIMDLDRFKNINDTMGHEAGDLLLQQATQRLSARLRDSDTLARLGGDEFALLIDDLSNYQDASIIATKILDTFLEPFFINQSKTAVSVSIGIAMYPEGGESISELLRNADTALYRAKDAGKNTFRYFTPELREKVSELLIIENSLRDAIYSNELMIFFQPIFSLSDESLYGAEALLRWRNYLAKNISVQKVIEVAEYTGLISQIGNFVVDQALRQYHIWCEKYNINFKVSINISPKQLAFKEFFLYVQTQLQHYQVNPENIIFEITETSVIDNMRDANAGLHLLANLGCQIFIDDFGSGFSSFNLLRELPITGLKIDRAFLKNIQNGTHDMKLLQSIFMLAATLKLTVIAEGIENNTQLAFLKAYPTQHAQGYLLGLPVDPEEFEKLYLLPKINQP